MANTDTPSTGKSPLARILQVMKMEREEITSVYLYAVLNGVIQLSLPLGIQSIISFVLGGSISTSLVILIMLVVTGVFFTGLVQVNQMRIIEKVQQKVFVRYAFEYAYRLPKLDLKSVDKYYLPETVNRFFDTVSLQKGIAKLLLEFPSASIQIFFGLILLSFYHPFFIAFSFTIIALLIAIIYFSGSRGLETSIRESEYKYGVVAWIEELARLVPSFKFSKGNTLNLRRIDSLVNGYLEARTSHFRILQFQYWTLIGFKVIITAVMLVVGSLLLINQQLNIGQFIAAEIVILLVLNSVEKIIINLDKVYDILTSVDKLGKIIDSPLEAEGGIRLLPSSTGLHISLRDMSFELSGKSVLTGVTLDVPAGSKVAVTGHDGSGKSTLLRMLSGVFTDYKGSFLINNIPMRDYQLAPYRHQTGILLSQQDIFFGTLLENITMGDETIHPEEIIKLVERIGLVEFMQEEGFGFSSVLDPLGKRLSRSVIQKILLLRAMINEPRLLLLEDPWRGLDDVNRLRIQDYIIEGCSDTTVFVESNDREFASRADIVCCFREGALVYAGPWKEGLL
jgi:ABC-type bacteriocin/lantibiotic exporter with double-glycine peptidase domain